MKFNALQHGSHTSSQTLKDDMEHIYFELNGLLLSKKGISCVHKAIYICKTYFNNIKKNKLSKFFLTNAL
jgi:hypothetical protein